MIRAEKLLVIVGFAAACGGQEPVSSVNKAPLKVAASPPGFMFDQAATVELTASRPSRIFYTVDGDDPIGPNALVYEHPIQLAQSTLITFIGQADDKTWSPPTSEFYASAPPNSMHADLIQRGLQLDDNNHFFSPQLGDTNLTATFHVKSIGIQAVHITRVHIDVSKEGRSFYEDGVFTIDDPPSVPLDLQPGKTLELVVRYAPTQTLRSAALYIESDELLHAPDSPLHVELWGRVFGN